MTDVRITSIADSSLDDRLVRIGEELARIADALERISQGGSFGGQPIRFE